MAEFPCLDLFTDAYLGDTTHLTTIEHGAYLLLLMTAWRTGEARLPADDRKLARFARLTLKQWQRIKPTIMEFWDEADGYITQGRLTDEWRRCQTRTKKASDSARARWLKTNGDVYANAMLEAMPPPPPPTEERKKDRAPNGAHAGLFDIDQKAETEKAKPANEEPKARLFREGTTIMRMLGEKDDKSRRMIGKWLKQQPDADGILAALTYAYENNVMDPIAYVTKLLNTGGKTDGRRTNGRQPLVEIGRELAEEARRREFEAGIGRAPDVERGH